MIPGDRAEPRATLNVVTRSELADGPLHRGESIEAEALLLFWIDWGNTNAPPSASVSAMMIADRPRLMRLGLAALDWLNTHMGLSDLMLLWQEEGSRSNTVVSHDDIIRDQPPLGDDDGRPR